VAVPVIAGVNLADAFIALAIPFCIYMVLSLTLNLEFGYAGVPNFGKVLFVAAGGALAGAVIPYIAAWILGISIPGRYVDSQEIVSVQINEVLAHNVLLSMALLVIIIVVAGAFGGVFGYVMSYPAIRLREDYLGMLLLASGEFMRIFLTAYYPLIGGDGGVFLPDPLASTNSAGLKNIFTLGLVAILAFIVYVYVERTARSPLGRTLKAVRENETASAALGKDNVALRRRALVIASVLSGVAGAMWVVWHAHVGSTDFVRADFTFIPWVMVIVGGAGNNIGVSIGAFALVAFDQVITQYSSLAIGSGSQSFFSINITRLEPIAYGILLIVVLLLRPEGILKEKPTPTLSKRKLLDMAAKIKPGGLQKTQEPKGVRATQRVLKVLVRWLARRKSATTPTGPPV
jgi:branched-chain amino acid transport system permease protein